MLGFDAGSEFPEEGGQFTGHRDLDFVVMKLSFSEGVKSVTETGLSSPGEFFDPAFTSFLSFGKLSTDLGWDAVVSCLFDEDPTSVRVSTFGDPALSFTGSTGVFSGNEAQEGHEFLGVLKAAEGSNFRDGDHGGNELKSFEGHHGIDEGLALPVFQELKHCFFEFGDALVMEVDGSEVVLKNSVVGGIGEPEITEVSFMSFSPVGLAGVVVAEAAKEGEESGFGATEIIDSVGTTSAKIANGFISGVWNIDWDEVIGAEIFGKFHGVAFVCFNAITRFYRDE